jgi:hypothetical protein
MIGIVLATSGLLYGIAGGALKKFDEASILSEDLGTIFDLKDWNDWEDW